MPVDRGSRMRVMRRQHDFDIPPDRCHRRRVKMIMRKCRGVACGNQQSVLATQGDVEAAGKVQQNLGRRGHLAGLKQPETLQRDVRVASKAHLAHTAPAPPIT
jgi:hypothetical protein